jgi:dienelactone hydrolase
VVTTADAATRRRNFSPWHLWMTRLAATRPLDPMPLDDWASFEAWRARCRARLVELLGPWPEPVPLNLETLEEQRADGYRQASVVFDSEDGMSVPAYLLVPDDRTEPGPAILACHGHGPGKALVVGLETTEAPNGDYARQLARRGYVVLAPDLRCFGERADWNPPNLYACDVNLVHATMAGVRPLTQNLFDLTRCLDVLEAHELVDPARLGMVGLSLGGTMTLFTAAWDDRVAAAVVSGFFSSWAEAHKVPWNMCGSQVLPGMLGQLEHVDLGALVAPRPLLVQTGTEDLIFPLAAARASVAQLEAVYRHLGAEGRLAHDVFEGDHEWREAGPAAFLDRWLGRPRAR